MDKKKKHKNNLTRKIKKLKKLYNPDPNAHVKWDYTDVISNIVIDFLAKRHKSCVIRVELYINHMFSRDNDLFITRAIKDINKCLEDRSIKEKDIILIPVKFTYTHEDANNEAHENLLVYRTKMKQLEWFEPHGKYFQLKMYPTINSQMNELVEKFCEKLNVDYLVRPNLVCPYLIGPQGREQKSEIARHNDISGYCGLWVCLIMDLIFKFPYLTTNEIIKSLLDNNNEDELRMIIKGFNIFLDKNFKKYAKVDFNEISDFDFHSSKKYKEDLEKIMIRSMSKINKKMYPQLHKKNSKSEHIFSSNISTASVYSKKTPTSIKNKKTSDTHTSSTY